MVFTEISRLAPVVIVSPKCFAYRQNNVIDVRDFVGGDAIGFAGLRQPILTIACGAATGVWPRPSGFETEISRHM